MRSLLAFLLASSSVCAQTSCEVLQFLKDDSINATVARVQTFNSRGQLITDKFEGYVDSLGRIPDKTYTYVYADALLKEWTVALAVGDSGRMKFEYNESGRLARQNYFLRKATQTELKKANPQAAAYTQPGPDDGKWTQTSLANYSYDDKGQRTLYDASRLHYSKENMFKWEYDNAGRVVKKQSFIGNKLSWQEDYQYSASGYRYWRTWYDPEGNMRHELDKESGAYRPMYVYDVKLDAQKRISEVRITDELNRPWGRSVTMYNGKGQISKTVDYDSKDQPFVTHLYSYK